MSDIFISYANENRPRAQALAKTLEGQNWSIFWDRTIPIGKTWRGTIGKELANARCVIVLWSKASVESDWVHEEADDAKQRGILIPIRIEDVRLPIGFRSIQTADLVGWNETEPTEAFPRLMLDIAALIGGHPKEVERRAGIPARAGKVFINYRRDDAIAMAGRLHDRLATEFGRENIFMDVCHIPIGADFVTYLSNQVAACEVVLAVIGPGWLNAADENGLRRLDNPGDFVVIEIAAALARNMRVIPVLVRGARMP